MAERPGVAGSVAGRTGECGSDGADGHRGVAVPDGHEIRLRGSGVAVAWPWCGSGSGVAVAVSWHTSQPRSSSYTATLPRPPEAALPRSR
eukprot:Skav231471  [mRNA]  locus=scaffold1100:398381:399846:- [translate_table: standard]